MVYMNEKYPQPEFQRPRGVRKNRGNVWQKKRRKEIDLEKGGEETEDPLHLL